eukprot:5856555-Pyramimonas_sp.AAC.1
MSSDLRVAEHAARQVRHRRFQSTTLLEVSGMEDLGGSRLQRASVRGNMGIINRSDSLALNVWRLWRELAGQWLSRRLGQ